MFLSADRVCRVQTDIQMQDGTINAVPAVGWPVGKFLAADYPEIEKVTYLRDRSPIINFKETHFYEDALFADSEFFNVFGYQLEEGNAANALTAPFSIVISKALKQKYFGNTNAIGKILMISDTIPYKVTGVFKDFSVPSHLKFDMIGSLSSVCSLYPDACKEEYASGWFDENMYNYVKLKKNVPVEVAESKIKNLILDKAPEAVAKTGFKPTLKLQPLTKIYLYSTMPTGKGTVGDIKTVQLFLIIGIFILIIACLNFINLTTAKSIERAKEIGIKKVLGSDRKTLVFQFITETAVLCFTACFVSILLMIFLLPVYNQFSGESFTVGSLFTGGNILLMAAIIVVLIPLAGFYPSWVLSSFKPISVLKGRFSHIFRLIIAKGISGNAVCYIDCIYNGYHHYLETNAIYAEPKPWF